jgi:hypothetical protein
MLKILAAAFTRWLKFDDSLKVRMRFHITGELEKQQKQGSIGPSPLLYLHP